MSKGASRSGGRARTARVALAALALAGGALVGATMYGFSYAEGLSYLSNDPRACVNCHIMRPQYDGWQKASHHAVAGCNDCHVPHDLVGKYLTKMDHGYRHSKGFTFQDFHEPIRITPGSLRVVEDNCVRCHSGLVSGIVGGAHSGDAHGSVHDTGCVRCHAAVGHGSRR
ncbi:MAG TPA: cytochrome c nitrite reductase small subunit [Phycisphaerales bacterium]|nr:cytochrome c nitrite reductase small subunit [Phycisphaerales bacterium]